MTGWTKSTFCSGGQCAEVKFVRDVVLVRDSKDLERPPLEFSRQAWGEFLDGVADLNFPA